MAVTGFETMERSREGSIRPVEWYEQYLGDMDTRYQEMVDAIEAQRAQQRARLRAQYDAAVEQLSRQRPGIDQRFEDGAKEAYIENMMAKRDLPQQLSAQGQTGGLAESSQIALEAAYGNQLRDARRERDRELYDLETRIGDIEAAGADALAGADGDYNRMLSDIRSQYLGSRADLKLKAQLAQLEEEQRQEALAYQKEQDALAQRNWQAQFDWQKAQAAARQAGTQRGQSSVKSTFAPAKSETGKSYGSGWSLSGGGTEEEREKDDSPVSRPSRGGAQKYTQVRW